MNRRTRRFLVSAPALVGALSVVAASPAAHAYVRAKTADGIPVYWTTSCASVTIYLNGFSMMSRDEVAKSLGAAAHAWSPDAVTCTAGDGSLSHQYFEIVPSLAADGAVPPAVGPDGHNIVVFHLDDWPVDFSANALAVTSLTKKRDGRILDADVEINAQWLEWGNLDPGDPGPSNGQGPAFDLQDAITHEFGHFIGLDHTCFGPADPPPPQVDNNGNTVPYCGPGAPDDVRQTVMYAIVDPGEVTQRVLSPDDIAAVCDVYPAARDPKVCSLDTLDDGCGCRVGRRTGSPARVGSLAPSFAILAVAWALARRRSRRPS
jgi:hypothetical protein